MAARRAPGSGRRGALLRALHRRRRQRLRRLRRHPQPGLRRRRAPRPRAPTRPSRRLRARSSATRARSPRRSSSRPRAATPRTTSTPSSAARPRHICAASPTPNEAKAGSSYHRWTRKLSQRSIEAELGALVRGRLKRIVIVKRGVSPRIVKAKVIGSAVPPGRPTAPSSAPCSAFPTPGPSSAPLAGCDGSETSCSHRRSSPRARSPRPSSWSGPTTDHPRGPPFVRRDGSALDAETRARMTGVSWRRGCPVGLDDLRHLSVATGASTGRVHTGAADRARDTAAGSSRASSGGSTRALPDPRHGADRRLRRRATSARSRPTTPRRSTAASSRARAAGRSTRTAARSISTRSRTRTCRPDGYARTRASRPYLDRSRAAPGWPTGAAAVVARSTSVGWGWGGRWRGRKDYQHFSKTGN